MAYKLKITDKRIINEIDLDCRRPLSIIAKKLKISQQRLQYRLKNLEKRGIIPFYYTLIDTSLVGYTFYRVMLRFQNTTHKKEVEIIKDLIQNSKTFWIATCTGRWDLIVDFFAKTVTEFDQIIEEFLEKYFNFISQKNIATIVSSKQYTRSFLFDEQKKIEFEESYGGTPKEIVLDKTDKEILKIIGNNPTIKNIEIGEKLKIDRNTAKNRINKMINEGLVVGFRGWLETSTVNYHSFKLIIRLNQAKKEIENKLLSFARINKNIIYFNKILGDWDFEYDIETKEEEDFYELLTKIKNLFSQEIKDYEILKINHNYKLNYIPLL